MHYIRQFSIILGVSCLGELLRLFIPLPIPSTIYGLLLMLTFLKVGLIRLEWVKEVGDFLIEIMPLLFVPATVGIMATWEQLEAIIIPVLVITMVSTFVIMIVSGKVTDYMLRKRGEEDESNIC